MTVDSLCPTHASHHEHRQLVLLQKAHKVSANSEGRKAYKRSRLPRFAERGHHLKGNRNKLMNQNYIRFVYRFHDCLLNNMQFGTR